MTRYSQEKKNKTKQMEARALEGGSLMCTPKVLQLINLGASVRQASVAGHSEQAVRVGADAVGL